MTPWSFSSLNQFETCPAQYAAERVYKTIERVSGPEADWGNEVHNALENRLRKKDPLISSFAGYENLAAIVDNMPGDKFYEHSIALTKDRRVTLWDAKDVWLRSAILDVLVVKDEYATVIDWKTGKVKENTLQLQLYALCVFAAFKNVEVVHGLYHWVAHDKVTRSIFHKEHEEELWEPIINKVNSLQEAYNLDIWTPRPSGLCKRHCANTDCEFHGIGNRRM